MLASVLALAEAEVVVVALRVSAAADGVVLAHGHTGSWRARIVRGIMAPMRGTEATF